MLYLPRFLQLAKCTTRQDLQCLWTALAQNLLKCGIDGLTVVFEERTCDFGGHIDLWTAARIATNSGLDSIRLEVSFRVGLKNGTYLLLTGLLF